MRRELLVSFLLVAAVAAVYWPVHSYPFVLLDDQGYVVQNPYVRKGLTREGFVHAFTGITVGNWHPLTMLSHMLDCQLFGVEERAGWHHVVNLALHAANTVLLFIALRRMTGALWRSALVAALFGLHPLHVESVAWISERKDVLSTLFFMLTLLAYYHYVQRPTILRYAAVFAVAGLGADVQTDVGDCAIRAPALGLLALEPHGRYSRFRSLIVGKDTVVRRSPPSALR